MTQSLPTRICLAVIAALAVAALPTVAHAGHAWSCYHWARTSLATEVTLNVGDNVGPNWDVYLDTAISDWDRSSVLALTQVAGATRPKSCRPTSGGIEVCASNYHNNGWLGLAQIWISGTCPQAHITQGTAKMNDYYFNQSQYNTPAWRQFVMCQEIGHDFGLTHTDETFNNANDGSCMDYTNDPDGGAGGADPNDPSNEHPNTHDYGQLEAIYDHADPAAATAPSANGFNHNAPAEWGRLVATHAGGRVQDFERDLGQGQKLVTRVVWASTEAE